MQIFVDDEPYQGPGPADQTVQTLADEICTQYPSDRKRIVVSLWCDGQPVQPDQLEAVLGSPASRFEMIQVQTAPVAAQVGVTLDQAIQVFEEAADTRRQIAEHLAAGRHEPAMQQLQKFLDILKQVQQTTFLACQLLNVDLETLRADGLDFPGILDAVKTQLLELKAAMENSDFVLVADLLRYEFDEPLQMWRSLLEHLRGRCSPD